MNSGSTWDILAGCIRADLRIQPDHSATRAKHWDDRGIRRGLLRSASLVGTWQPTVALNNTSVVAPFPYAPSQPNNRLTSPQRAFMNTGRLYRFTSN